MQRRNIMQQLTERADLPMEPVPGLPVVEIAGDCRVLIENHLGITQYDPDSILVKVRFGHIRILGENLELSCMSSHQVIVRGKIHGVEVMKGG